MPDPAPASVLFITGGSGITPVMSMLRTLSRRDQIADIVHLHSAPTESDVLFAAELAELQRSHPGYRLRCRLPASTAASTCRGLTTRCPTGAIAIPGRAARREC